MRLVLRHDLLQIEAAAHGVPLVATMHGGPVDIIKTLRSGHLVEPSDSEKVAECILKLLTDPKHWDKCSQRCVWIKQSREPW